MNEAFLGQELSAVCRRSRSDIYCNGSLIVNINKTGRLRLKEAKSETCGVDGKQSTMFLD